jgi:hypothetical protein
MYSETRVSSYRARSYGVQVRAHKYAERKFTRNKLTPRGKFDRKIDGSDDPFSSAEKPSIAATRVEFSHPPSPGAVHISRALSQFCAHFIGLAKKRRYRYRRRNVIFCFLVIFLFISFSFLHLGHFPLAFSPSTYTHGYFFPALLYCYYYCRV